MVEFKNNFVKGRKSSEFFVAKKINLGSGSKLLKGFVNVDYDVRRNPDVVHDLAKFPYPFKSNSADFIEMSHVLEHLPDPYKAIKEVHRILKKGGTFHIKVPYYNYPTAFAIGHIHFFNLDWFSGYGWQNPSDFSHVYTKGNPSIVGRFFLGQRFRQLMSYFISGLIIEVETLIKKK